MTEPMLTMQAGTAVPAALSLLDLLESAAYDEVTGTLVRRAWTARAEREIATCSPHRCPALLILDLDHFKACNDTYGHQAGDRVLAAVVWAIRSELRHVDVIGRLGGDELVVLLTDRPEPDGAVPDIDVDRRAGSGPVRVAEVAERLRRGVEALRVEMPAPLISQARHSRPAPSARPWVWRSTVSIGAAVAAAGAAPGLAELLGAADAALYEAKRAGRNQVRVTEAGSAGIPRSRPAVARAGIRRPR